MISKNYCSAYGRGSARLVRDNQGRTFVLLTYSEGHGTRATVDYVGVEELVGNVLRQRGRLLKSEPIGIEADLVFDLSIEPLPKGGISISGASHVVGKLQQGEVAPERQTVSLTVV